MSTGKHAVIVSFAGGNASSIAGPLDVFEFARANADDTADFRVTVLSKDGAAVNCGGCVTVTPSGSVHDVGDVDIVFLAGMPCDVDEVLADNNGVFDWISEQHRRGAAIAAVCPSQALLAHGGMLDGRNVAMHWSLIDEVRARWPAVNWTTDRMVVEDRGIYSCCGAGAAIDLALYIVDSLCGRDAMLACTRWFLMDLPRVRQNVPPPQIARAPAVDSLMEPVESWILGHFHEPVRFQALAGQFGMSWRTFYRRFLESFGDPPKVYLQKLRINAARRLLEKDAGTIEQIATRVGYSDPAFFRTLFSRHVGMTPSHYRESFRFRALT
jgi:transcriptional regulator GlxA family with amidase domain